MADLCIIFLFIIKSVDIIILDEFKQILKLFILRMYQELYILFYYFSERRRTICNDRKLPDKKEVANVLWFSIVNE